MSAEREGLRELAWRVLNEGHPDRDTEKAIADRLARSVLALIREGGEPVHPAPEPEPDATEELTGFPLSHFTALIPGSPEPDARYVVVSRGGEVLSTRLHDRSGAVAARDALATRYHDPSILPVGRAVSEEGDA